MRSIVLTTLLLTVICARSQDFDRLLEKDIKTEINLNRIAKSQNPLQLSSFHKKLTDSLTLLAYNSYVEYASVNSLGVQEDWQKIWQQVLSKLDTDHYYDFNATMLRYGDYKKGMKEDMLNNSAFYYKLENQNISLSAIRFGDKIFLTTVTW
jgi:hypothetical protein